MKMNFLSRRSFLMIQHFGGNGCQHFFIWCAHLLASSLWRVYRVRTTATQDRLDTIIPELRHWRQGVRQKLLAAKYNLLRGKIGDMNSRGIPWPTDLRYQ